MNDTIITPEGSEKKSFNIIILQERDFDALYQLAKLFATLNLVVLSSVLDEMKKGGIDELKIMP